MMKVIIVSILRPARQSSHEDKENRCQKVTLQVPRWRCWEELNCMEMRTDLL